MRKIACEFGGALEGDKDWRSFIHCRKDITGLIIASAICEVRDWCGRQMVVEVEVEREIAEVGVGSAFKVVQGLDLHNPIRSTSRNWQILRKFTLQFRSTVSKHAQCIN